MNQNERCLWLIRALLDEMPQYGDTPIPALPDYRWRLLRSLMNVRPPMPAAEEFLRVQDAYLRQMTGKEIWHLMIDNCEMFVTELGPEGYGFPERVRAD